MTVLEGPRVRLEPTTPALAPRIWAAVERSLPELRPWLAWAVDPSPEDTEAFAAEAERSWGRSTWAFTIFVGSEVAGSVGLNQHKPLLRSAQLGYWIRSDLGGRGLTTEAVDLVVDFAFETLGLHRLELHAAPENRASVRVAEKLGFRRGGILRDGSRGAGGYHDVAVFDLLRTDRLA